MFMGLAELYRKTCAELIPDDEHKDDRVLEQIVGYGEE